MTELKTEQVGFRCTPTEREQLEELAASYRLKTGDMIRLLLDFAYVQRPDLIAKSRPVAVPAN